MQHETKTQNKSTHSQMGPVWQNHIQWNTKDKVVKLAAEIKVALHNSLLLYACAVAWTDGEKW